MKNMKMIDLDSPQIKIWIWKCLIVALYAKVDPVDLIKGGKAIATSSAGCSEGKVKIEDN